MIKRSKKEIIEFYKNTIDFWADFLGSEYEIVLHDIENLENSIVYIRNNFSGRQIGGPITNLGLKVIKEKKYHNENYFVNYISKTSDGKVLRSATQFIKDDEDNLVAMMCINIDVTKAMEFNNFLKKYINGEKHSLEIKDIEQEDKSVITETLNTNVEDVVNHIINEVMLNTIIPPERMTNEEKYEIINILNEKGVFLIKGSVKKIANKLKISDTTIYRIISK